ncbi:related to UTR1 (associated with ferric reductase activity) [Melanopsichium pennsylvanicum]|uniref:Related to UTR1 (Associated with ferric reductase activity) n=1 Tax=Melanopsichium pennsylvanicum TaxID=63383 RepID=A0AAJ5C2U0_9BASI|nr:related to UTR1 (associated with ferric reductase activity) [Melanopsichium pennsylvanicum]
MSASPGGSDQPNLPHKVSKPIRSMSMDPSSQPTLLNPGMATNPTSGLTRLEPPKPCSSKASSSMFQDTTDSPASSLPDQTDDATPPLNKTHAKVHDVSSLPHAHSSDQSTASLTSPCFVHSYLDRGVALGESLKKQRRQLSRQRARQSRGSNKLSQSDTASADDDFTPRARRNKQLPVNEDPTASSSGTSQASPIPTSASQALAEEEKLSSSNATSNYPKRGIERISARVGIRTSSDDDDDDDDGDADNIAHQPSSDPDSSYGSSCCYSTDEEDSDKVRSLTRQLAETAVGVREMSKQLGRARVKSTIQSVMIITKARDNHLIKLTRELAIWLMTTPRNGKDTGLIVYVDSQLRQSKRFDAGGIRRDYPQLFASAQPKRTPNLSSSLSSTSAHDGNGSFNRNEGGNQLRFWNADMCSRSPHLFDFVVTLGGDGTVLFCSWLFQRIVPPVLPFALGSLGFLTNFDFKAYQDVMKSALDDGIRVNLRMRFTATVYRATLSSSSSADRHRRQAIKSGKTGEIILNSVKNCGWDVIESPNHDKDHRPRSPLQPQDEMVLPSMEKSSRTRSKGEKGKKCRDKEIMCFSTRPVETFEVLNDLVVDRGPSPYVSLLEVFGDEHHMTTAQADGLCISTPTGSTAYSLSAGGSLVHPEIPAILISPICPHTLSFRPMLLPDSMELRIAVPYNSRSTAWASFDGRGRVELKQGDHIKVTASRYPFPTVCAENQSTDWFSSISRTLKWNERQRQKSFVVVEEGAEGDSNGGGDKDKNSSSTASPNKMFAKHGNNGEAESSSDDDDNDGDEGDSMDQNDDEEDAEKFDIDDTSTTVTRSNSPNSHGDGHVRRRSGQSTPRHTNGGPRRSSVPSLLSSSLPRLTSITNSFGQKPGEGNAGALSAASSNSGSLLNSPDRFGLQGPPLPPKAISERHLLNADFRLDGGRATSSLNQRASSSSSKSRFGAEAGPGATPRAARSDERERRRRTQSKPMTPASALARDETPQGVRESNKEDDSSRKGDRYDRSGNDTGGTALVVYGEDESDSDSTTGAGH